MATQSKGFFFMPHHHLRRIDFPHAVSCERRVQLQHGGNGRTVDLDQRVGLEDCLNGWQMTFQQNTDVLRRDVARLDQEQLPGAALQDMRIKEIRVLRNNDPLFKYRDLIDDGILRLVPGRKIQRVHRVVSMLSENDAEPT